jgi:hypothetical protein
MFHSHIAELELPLFYIISICSSSVFLPLVIFQVLMATSMKFKESSRT